MFQVQLTFVVNLLKVFLVWLLNFLKSFVAILVTPIIAGTHIFHVHTFAVSLHIIACVFFISIIIVVVNKTLQHKALIFCYVISDMHFVVAGGDDLFHHYTHPPRARN